MPPDKDYLLGTHDEEIARLGLQHRIWRPRTLDAWRRAGFTVGQTILDVGCGPGYAALDLAEIVGLSGWVYAFDRSKRFLDTLESARKARGIDNITAIERDLDEDLPIDIKADAAWTRWVFAFVKNPRKLLSRVAKALKPGGVFVIFEYFDYSTWRLAPQNASLEEFVEIVIESWRAEGGEPDIGLTLPQWLSEEGFAVKSLSPIIDIVPSSNYIWQWPKAFIEVGIKRLADLGKLTPARATAMRKDIDKSMNEPNTLMITPGVLEIIAVRE